MKTFLTLALKWLPYLLQAIAPVLTIIGTHNNAAMQAGAEVPTMAAAPLLGAGILITAVAAFLHFRNLHAAESTIPAATTLPGASSEDQLLGLLAQEFARKSDPRLDKLSSLYPPPQKTQLGR